jgi:hypothetical protein
MGTYPDVEQALAVWLGNTMAVRSVTETPANLSTTLPVISVDRIGGADPTVSIDEATVDVEVFHTNRILARTLALAAQAAIRYQLPGQTLGGGVVTRTKTISAPHWVPYDDTNLRRFVATYQVVVSDHP